MLHYQRTTYDPTNQTVSRCKSRRTNTLSHIQCLCHSQILPQKGLLLYAESCLWTQGHDGWVPLLWNVYFHGPGLTASSLTIGKNCAVEATDDWLDNRPSDFFVDLDLLGGGAEYSIKGKVIFVLFPDLHLHRHTLMVISLLVYVTHSTPLLAI